jgi:hypothetical protein
VAAPITADLRSTPVGDGADAARLRTLLSASARYCLDVYLPTAVKPDATLSTPDESTARAVSGAALNLAVGRRCAAFDDSVHVEAAEAAALRAVRACVVAHLTQGGSWGRTWQSPLASGQLGLAAWLLWEELTNADRVAVEQVLRDEAVHLAGVPVRYLRGVDGRYVSEGDTGAEEESWRARGISIALAMLPDDAQAQRWFRALVLRQLAAYARPSDVGRTDLLHRSPVCTWLAGSNLEPNGDLQNHHFNPQPNYMRPVHHVAALMHLRLAGAPVSPSALHNLDLLYAALRRLYNDDGGLDYPSGTDAGTRAVILYANDVQHRALGIGGDDALRWERLHGAIAERQVQPDGRIAEPGDTAPYGAVPPDIATKLAEAYLALVLGPASAYPIDDTTLAGAPEQGATPACPTYGRSFADVTGAVARAASWVDSSDVFPGSPDGDFRPNEPVRRSAALVSMWRAAGSPTGYPTHPFSDVAHDGSEPDLAVRWATAVGVSVGRAMTLGPDEPLTRAQAVLLLWRERGRPGAPASAFSDVAGEVAEAVGWAQLVGVSAGATPTTFDPGRSVTRGQWALMLHRKHAVG